MVRGRDIGVPCLELICGGHLGGFIPFDMNKWSLEEAGVGGRESGYRCFAPDNRRCFRIV